MEISYEPNKNCTMDMVQTNNTAYNACIDNLKSKPDQLNIVLYCFEALNLKMSDYFLVLLLIYIPIPAILYYKTATFSGKYTWFKLNRYVDLAKLKQPQP